MELEIPIFNHEKVPYSSVSDGITPDEDDFINAFRSAFAEADDFQRSYLEPFRTKALQFYQGKAFANDLPPEQQVSSQVVMSVLRDTIQSVLPTLMRIFTGGDSAVEFVPSTPADVPIAKLKTQYLNHVFYQDNPGFKILYSVFKEASLLRLGAVKYWYSRSQEQTQQRYIGLDEIEASLVRNDPTCQVIQDERDEKGFFNITIKRYVSKNRAVIQPVPQDQLLVNRRATCVDDAKFIGHESDIPASDVIAMGYDPDEIYEHVGTGPTNYEQFIKNPALATGDDSSSNKSMQLVRFVEAYFRYDMDGDGIAEIHKVHAIGSSLHILHHEVVSRIPFALLSLDPAIDTLFDGSIADQTMDLQQIQSNVMRATLDSLAASIHPRTKVVRGRVDIDSVLNTAQGAVIETFQSTQDVEELVKPYVGNEALQLMSYLEQVRAARTGISQNSAGLTEDLLASKSNAAVTSVVSSAQERLELYCRIISETFMKPLFIGLAQLIQENQDEERMIQVNGEFVTVDPRSWVAETAAVPNVALGRGTEQEKMKFLTIMLQKQEEILKTIGMMNPLVGLDNYYNTLKELVTMAGFKAVDNYFKPITPQVMQQLAAQQAQAAQQQQPTDPRMALVQVEQQKAMAENQVSAGELHRKQTEMILDANMRREQNYTNAAMKYLEICTKAGMEFDPMKFNVFVQTVRRLADQDLSSDMGQMNTTQQPGIDPQQMAQALLMQQQQQAPQGMMPQ